MSTEITLDGADLTALVTNATLTRENAESALVKMSHAIKRKMCVHVALYTVDEKSTVKIYPLDQKQAEFVNHRTGETLYAPATEWKAAYDTKPLPTP